MLMKYIHHLVLDSQISMTSDDSNHILDPESFQHVTFIQYMSWKMNEITTSSSPPPPPTDMSPPNRACVVSTPNSTNSAYEL